MNPNLTPLRSLKSSFFFSRISMIADISTSLKVVKIAAVFCDSFNRVAMVCLILDIGTISSLSVDFCFFNEFFPSK